MRFPAQTDSTLTSHLKYAPHNTTYLSKTIQNQLINVIGNYLRKYLIAKIKRMLNITPFWVTMSQTVAIRNHCL